MCFVNLLSKLALFYFCLDIVINFSFAEFRRCFFFSIMSYFLEASNSRRFYPKSTGTLRIGVTSSGRPTERIGSRYFTLCNRYSTLVLLRNHGACIRVNGRSINSEIFLLNGDRISTSGNVFPKKFF